MSHCGSPCWCHRWRAGPCPSVPPRRSCHHRGQRSWSPPRTRRMSGNRASAGTRQRTPANSDPRILSITRVCCHLVEGEGAGGGAGGGVGAGVARVADVGGVGGDGGAAGGGGDQACTQQQSADVSRGTIVATHSTLRSPPRSCRHRTRPASSTPSWW